MQDDDNCYSEARCFVVRVGLTEVGSVTLPSASVENEQMESLVGCDSFLCVLLSELMAAMWINGFANGQEATGRAYSMSIYNCSNMPANQINGRDAGRIKYRYVNYSSSLGSAK